MPEFSLPSENAPAPPSPNCTLLAGFSAPPRQNDSTSSARASTGLPRSTTTGASPARASLSAANSPAGPMPTTSGECLRGRALGSALGGTGETISAPRGSRFSGRFVSTSSVSEKWTSPLSRASTDRRTIRTEAISSSRTRSAFAASRASGREA